jgi:hypothetical protein
MGMLAVYPDLRLALVGNKLIDVKKIVGVQLKNITPLTFGQNTGGISDFCTPPVLHYRRRVGQLLRRQNG